MVVRMQEMQETNSVDLHGFYSRMVESARTFSELYEAMDGWSEVVLEENPILDCQKGCARCCMHQVLVSDAEWELIHTWMRKHLTKKDRQEIIGRIEGQLEEPNNPLSRWLAMRNKHPKAFVRSVNQGFGAESTRCAMLGPDNRCEIYPVRPFVCRAYGRARLTGGTAMICEVFGGRFRQKERSSDDVNLEDMTVMSTKYFEFGQSHDGRPGLYTLMAAHLLRNRTTTGDLAKQPQTLNAEKTFPVVTKDDFPIGN
jgi:Fe-S-cluster containining protein